MRSSKILLILFFLSSNAFGLEFQGKYLSNGLKQQLQSWKQARKTVNGVYLFSIAWIATAGKDVRCSKDAPESLCLVMKQIGAQNGVVLDYAQAPTGEFIVLSTLGAHYSNSAYFSSMGLVSAINQLNQSQQRVNSVALFENGGWLIIAQGEIRSKNLPASLQLALEESRLGAHYLTRIVSRFKNANETEWLLIANADYWTNRTDAYLQDVLHQFMKERFYLGPVFFEGSRFIAVVNHKRFVTDPMDRLENDLRDVNNNGKAFHILERMEHYKVPGVTIAVIDGDSITTRTYGVLNNSSKLKARTSSYYPSASLSKAIFSYGMLKAHESGVIDLDQTLPEFAQAHPNGLVKKWLDSLPSTRDEPYEYRSRFITIRSLLSHSGGTSVHGIGLYSVNQMRTLSDLIMGTNGRDKTNPIDFPNLSIRYSGGGYSLAEAALEDATGRRAQEWLGLNVLRPLNMEGSTFGHLHPTREIDFARGHGPNSIPKPVRYCPGKGAGGLTTNAYDYAKFLWSVMNEGRIFQTNQRYMTQNSHREIFTPAFRPTSSLSSCSRQNPCEKAGEICSLNRCLLPALDRVWYRHHGPGQMHSTFRTVVQEENETLLYPSFTEHGGGQAGIRTKFFYRYAQKKGFVVFTNAEHSWVDEDEVSRGGDPLIDEIKAAFDRVW